MKNSPSYSQKFSCPDDSAETNNSFIVLQVFAELSSGEFHFALKRIVSLCFLFKMIAANAIRIGCNIVDTDSL